MRLISDEALAVATIWLEARGESLDGKIAVAEVIRNRTARKYASDGTVAGTCFAPLQFSGWNSLDKNRAAALQLDDADPTVAECLDAWLRAAQGSARTDGAVCYLNPDVTRDQRGDGTLPAWAADPFDRTRLDERKVALRLGHHVFLRVP